METRKHCFLSSDWLKFETLPRKYRTLLVLLLLIVSSNISAPNSLYTFIYFRTVLKNIFHCLDLNGDMLLSRSEFELFHLTSSGEPLSDSMWDVIKGENLRLIFSTMELFYESVLGPRHTRVKVVEKSNLFCARLKFCCLFACRPLPWRNWMKDFPR